MPMFYKYNNDLFRNWMSWVNLFDVGCILFDNQLVNFIVCFLKVQNQIIQHTIPSFLALCNSFENSTMSGKIP